MIRKIRYPRALAFWVNGVAVGELLMAFIIVGFSWPLVCLAIAILFALPSAFALPK